MQELILKKYQKTTTRFFPSLQKSRLHVPGLEPFSIISSLKKWVNTSGAYISLVALLIFGVKLLFDIMLIITALFKRAPAIALALLINTCSTSYQTYKSYRLKEEDVKRQMKRKEEMEMTPLQQISTNKYPVRRQQEPFQDGNSYLLKCLKRVISFHFILDFLGCSNFNFLRKKL